MRFACSYWFEKELSRDMHLYAISFLGREGRPVRAADVAGWFGISCSAVRHSLKELIAGGYVIRDSRGCLSLSEEGAQCAAPPSRTHR